MLSRGVLYQDRQEWGRYFLCLRALIMQIPVMTLCLGIGASSALEWVAILQTHSKLQLMAMKRRDGGSLPVSTLGFALNTFGLHALPTTVHNHGALLFVVALGLRALPHGLGVISPDVSGWQGAGSARDSFNTNCFLGSAQRHLEAESWNT